MAVRGLNFAVVLRKKLCHPPVRFLRTKNNLNVDEIDSNPDFEGAYSSAETIQNTAFGAIRCDRQNVPHRHGEFEITSDENPLLGFDIPIPKKVLLEVERNEKRDTEGEPLSGPPIDKRDSKTIKKKVIPIKTVVKEVESEFAPNDSTAPSSAFEAVRSELSEKDKPSNEEKKDSFGFRILRAEIKPQIWTMKKPEILSCLLRNILFDSPEVLVLNKPYGLSMHGGGRTPVDDPMALTAHLDAMAKAFRVDALYPVHRLDKDVTGVLCIAKNKEMARTIEEVFKSRQVLKEYVAITRGVPPAKEGIIDQAIAVGTFEGRERMVIVPTAEPGSLKSVAKFEKTFPAVTRYKVVSSTKVAAFVRLMPSTGYKHQLRVHLGFGLRCPILGDHKYTSVRDMSPQKLPGEILDRLKIRSQKVRYVPLHLHCRHMAIPGILGGGRNLVVKSAVPTNFKRNVERLRLEY